MRVSICAITRLRACAIINTRRSLGDVGWIQESGRAQPSAGGFSIARPNPSVTCADPEPHTGVKTSCSCRLHGMHGPGLGRFYRPTFKICKSLSPKVNSSIGNGVRAQEEPQPSSWVWHQQGYDPPGGSCNQQIPVLCSFHHCKVYWGAKTDSESKLIP